MLEMEVLSGYLVGRSGWTRDVDLFLHWLSAIPFSGGGFGDAAIAEGLSEAIMMFSTAQNGSQNQQNVDCQKHCVLIAASNPHALPTPVYRPQMQNLEQNENIDAQTENHLCDAEAVAKSFPQCSVSLSVICPKQLPKLRAIYNAGKRNAGAADPPIGDAKEPHFLVLISENFMEACATLSRPGITTLPSNQSPVKMEIAPVASVTVPPPTSMPSVNGSVMNRQPILVGNVPPATVKVEPSTLSSMGPGFAHIPCVHPPSQAVPSLQTSTPFSASQGMTTINDSIPDFKPLVSSMTHPSRPVGCILNNISQAHFMNAAALTGGTFMGLQTMVQNPMAMHVSNMMSALGSSGASSGTGTMIPTLGMAHKVQSGMQSLGANNSSAASVPFSQQTTSALASAQSNYVKVWEGNLAGLRYGQPTFITILEGFGCASASGTLAANWPPTMLIVRLISEDHMHNKQYVGKADFLVFRAKNQHAFLGKLQEMKLCAVIQLPSQTLLLSVSDRAYRLNGMLFPGDMILFKPQVGGQEQQQQMQQMQQIQVGGEQHRHMQVPSQQQQQQMQVPSQQQQHPQSQQQHPQIQRQYPQIQQQQLSQLQSQQLTQLQQSHQQHQQQQLVGMGMAELMFKADRN
ncbi:mediator of RNA polymerase II transcription subunit 25 isoform X2 [Pyrus x bretschneideri]|uniref:mediator of RNA polymerase II transcription subunit 25 isoform X2 n=1 Tax=Pyrus x bretschneideri TaxID=225117 RepID=UPI0020307EC2|nr:mediator of RNA polymerase II transcription subunit 25 isoform X2 [Pyrus x bretschneideri]XP_048427793.1 mediator of RNA polymerase II transcription subunit 25 isoform X2 [Pyrus x bretschneideri]